MVVKWSRQRSIRRWQIMPTGGKRGLRGRLGLRLGNQAGSVAVYRQWLARGSSCSLMAKDGSSGRRNRAAGIKCRCSMKTTTPVTPDPAAAQVHRQCLLLVVAGTRTITSPTGCLHWWRPLHRADRLTEGRRSWHSWVGRMVVVVVVVLEVMAVLLEAA